MMVEISGTLELRDLEVMIVDDVRTIRFQIKELLFICGFRKFSFIENGGKAQIHLKSNRCDLILSDWHMDPVSGIELLKWVRRSPEFAHIPFILITAEQTRDSVMEAIAAEVDQYLIKPISMQQVQTKVLGALRKRKVIL